MKIMESNISATEAVRRFSDILNRVRYRGDEFTIERGGEPVCRIIPAGIRRLTVAELAEVLATAPAPDPEFLDEVEALSRNQPRVPDAAW
jgi:prevent-host-death family protein